VVWGQKTNLVCFFNLGVVRERNNTVKAKQKSLRLEEKLCAIFRQREGHPLKLWLFNFLMIILRCRRNWARELFA
jgi:hypothetical protein